MEYNPRKPPAEVLTNHGSKFIEYLRDNSLLKPGQYKSTVGHYYAVFKRQMYTEGFASEDKRPMPDFAPLMDSLVSFGYVKNDKMTVQLTLKAVDKFNIYHYNVGKLPAATSEKLQSAPKPQTKRTEETHPKPTSTVTGKDEAKTGAPARAFKTQRSRVAVDQHLTKIDKALQGLPVPNSAPKAQDKSRPLPPGGWLRCMICSVQCPSETSMDQHLKGRKHRAKVLLTALKMKRYVLDMKCCPWEGHAIDVSVYI